MVVLCTQAMAPEELDAIRAAAPGVEAAAASDGADQLERAADAEVIFAGRFDLEVLAAAPRLRWVQVGSAGVEGYPLPELAARGVLVTSMAVFGVPIAEHLLAMMLALT